MSLLGTTLIRSDEQDSIHWLCVDSPASLGPEADHLAWELIDRCTAVAEQERMPNGIVLRGGGGAFWALPPRNAAECDAAAGPWAEAVAAVASLECPTVAVLEADALGPSWELALACDLRIASPSARLGSPEVQFGRMPTAGGTQRLARLAGVGTALELALLGQPLPATQARELGLVQIVTEPEELVATLDQLLARLRSAAPIALALAKEAVHRGMDLTLAEGLVLELDLSALLQTTADRAAGIAAFQERRPPRFEGR